MKTAYLFGVAIGTFFGFRIVRAHQEKKRQAADVLAAGMLYDEDEIQIRFECQSCGWRSWHEVRRCPECSVLAEP